MLGSKLWEGMEEKSPDGTIINIQYKSMEQDIMSLLHPFRAASPITVVEVKPFTLKNKGANAVL